MYNTTERVRKSIERNWLFLLFLRNECRGRLFNITTQEVVLVTVVVRVVVVVVAVRVVGGDIVDNVILHNHILRTIMIRVVVSVGCKSVEIIAKDGVLFAGSFDKMISVHQQLWEARCEVMQITFGECTEPFLHFWIEI
jgi:hypothetical protein